MNKTTISPNLLSPNHRAISAEENVDCSIVILKGCTGSMTMTENTFKIHQSTLTNAVEEVCADIVTYVWNQSLFFLNLKIKLCLKCKSLKLH